MIQCGNLIECLKNEDIFPQANASSYSDTRKPENAFVPDSSEFCGTYEDNGWWEVDFQRHVTVESYKIRTFDGNTFGGWLYNWRIDVSFDRISWIWVHTQRNTNCVNTPVFTTGYSNKFRYFRITSTGYASSITSQNVAFIYIEFKGTYDPKPIKITKCYHFLERKNQLRIQTNILSLILCIS